MAKAKTVKNMTADELFALAAKRAEEEKQREQVEQKAKRDEMRAERKAMVARHRKELAALDAEIRKLGGRSGGARKSRGGVSEAVLGAIGDAGEISTKDLKAALAANGVSAGNLGQTLAYLKRTGRVKSPRRSVYKLA